MPLLAGQSADPQLARLDDHVLAPEEAAGAARSSPRSGRAPGPAARRCTPSSARTGSGPGRPGPAAGTASGSPRRGRTGASGRPRPPGPGAARPTSPRRSTTPGPSPPSRRPGGSTASSTARILSSRLQPAAADPGGALQRRQRLRLRGQHVQDPLDLRLVRDAGGGEVLPDPLVGLARHQHGRARRPAPARPGRPAGSRRPARPASRGGCRTRGRACRSPCPAPRSPPAPSPRCGAAGPRAPARFWVCPEYAATS